MATMTVEGYIKFVKSFETAKGTGYNGVISNSKKRDDGTYANADIRFAYFGYDAELQDNTLVHMKGMLGVDDYNPELPKATFTGFEMLPLSNKDGDKSYKKVDSTTKDSNPYG